MKYIKMPKLGESVHEGTIEEWLVSPGSVVNEYDPLCEVLTDKVTAEVPSSFSGTITKLLVDVGETIEVGTPICEIETDDSNDQSENNTHIEDEETGVSKPSEQNEQHVKRISPVVMRLATKHNIDLDSVTGTGKFGRVTKKDILNYIDSNKNEKERVVETKPKEESTQVNTSKEIKVTGVRETIAKNMVKASNEIPHAWMMVEVDATNLVNLRNKYKEKFKADGVKLTYFSFFVEAVAKALNKHKILNSTWNDNSIKIHDDINVNIAVAADDSLYVPVIRNADMLSIKGLAKQIETLANKGRNHKLSPEDFNGGTFTINNTGAFGSIQSMGIINAPQAAILQVESIVKKPVFIDDMLAARYMVNLCLSIDHRILDGLQAGQFLQEVKEIIESIDPNTTL